MGRRRAEREPGVVKEMAAKALEFAQSQMRELSTPCLGQAGLSGSGGKGPEVEKQPSPEAMAEMVELSTKPLTEVLTSAGVGTRFTECLKAEFAPEAWKERTAQERQRLFSTVLKLVELSEGVRINLKLEGQAGATKEELERLTAEYMQAWRSRMGVPSPQ